MDTTLQFCVGLWLVVMCNSQLFPFSSLHQYVMKDMVSTETTPAESVHHPVRVEVNERPSRQSGPGPEPLTVLVTPRPKYTPQNFVQEPPVGPNNDSVPAMMDEKTFRQRAKPQQHLIDVEDHRKNVHHVVKIQVRPQQGGKTVVDSVPSLSVVIPAELNKDNGPSDYLRPPRYPSVYNNKPTHTLAEFNTTPLRDLSKGSKEPSKYHPQKEWHRKPDKKQTVKRKVRGKTTEPNLKLESQIQWGPSSGSVETYTHKTPNYHLDPYYDHYVEQVIQDPQQQFTTFHDYKISSGFSSHILGLGLEDDPDTPRVEYHTHGHQGPQSYKFGYDTGIGANRTFRFEEKDGAGEINGQYGYYDKRGKLKVVTYKADENGFRSIST